MWDVQQALNKTHYGLWGSFKGLKRLGYLLVLKLFFSYSGISLDMTEPLKVDEVISYDLQLVVRQKTLYLQVMWAYLEQQSFPMDQESYRLHISQVLEIINREGFASSVREWLLNVNKKPRVGRALTLKLELNKSFNEFVL